MKILLTMLDFPGRCGCHRSVYYQLAGDSGSGDHVGSFKSRVASIGPEVGYSFSAGGLQWYANLLGRGVRKTFSPYTRYESNQAPVADLTQ
jgi:hypothetical protein